LVTKGLRGKIGYICIWTKNMHVSVIKYANCKINTPARRYEKQFGPNEIYGVQLAGNKRKMCKVHLSSRKDCFLPFSTLSSEFFLLRSLCVNHWRRRVSNLPPPARFPQEAVMEFSFKLFSVQLWENAAKAKEAVNCLN